MKTLALATVAATLALGAASPAFAVDDNHSLYDFNSTITSIDRAAGTVSLSLGGTLHDFYAVPADAEVGDEVRVQISDNRLVERLVKVN